ncbi:hypothetical protein Micbo1qcDRAFT_158022, partial [Microdochium bolleyi]
MSVSKFLGKYLGKWLLACLPLPCLSLCSGSALVTVALSHALHCYVHWARGCREHTFLCSAVAMPCARE